MSIFVIGDLHLSLSPNNEKPMDIFGDRWYNHTERIKDNWCSEVKSNDTVIIAGDISWGLKLEDAAYDLRWIDGLPGKKIILKGNHDLWWSGINKLNSMYDSITFLQNDAILVEGLWICGSRGWITPDDDDFTEADRKIYNREILRLKASLDRAPVDEEKIGILHFPPAGAPDRFTAFMQMFEDYGVNEVYYGHIHGSDGFRTAMEGNFHGIEYRLISADRLNCRLLKIRE